MIPFERISGLSPEVWVSVGTGFAREEIKALVLAQGKGFVGNAIITLQELCSQLSEISTDRLLTSTSRQEVLRILLSDSRITSQMPEIKRLKRQRNFFKRLDLSLQAGRMAFAHSEEEEVYEERLTQILGSSPIRKELRILTSAYEAWMSASNWVDLPWMLRIATERLRVQGWPKTIPCPKEIWTLSPQTPESREKEFLEVLAHHVLVRPVSYFSQDWKDQCQIQWQKWHTLDDAAESLADLLVAVKTEEQWKDHAILIPDIPSIRRSLRRALDSRKIPLAEPRDPTRLRWDEAIKWALIPLEVIAKNFERHRVIAYLRAYQMDDKFPDWINEINSRGIRQGLQSFEGGSLEEVYQKLSLLQSQLGGRKTCEELSKSHQEFLKKELENNSDFAWLIDFFEHLWKVFLNDMEKTHQANRKAPLYFWLERLRSRLSESSPPVDRIKPTFGIEIYRLQQAPVKPVKRLWIFGLPSHWLTGYGIGDYWFSEREREILALEFAVRSAAQIREERIQILRSWVLGSEEVTFLDSEFSPDGKERESIFPILKEIEIQLERPFPSKPRIMGAHPRFLPSFGAIRPVQDQIIQLPELPIGVTGMGPELTATEIDRYSRCSFQALGFHRWKLKDAKEPSTELWAHIRGNILHEAVRLLLEGLDSDGNFTLTSSQAVEKAWLTKKPRGLIQTDRVRNYAKFKLIEIINQFCESERNYIQRSGARPTHLDKISFRIQFEGFSIRGQPDRIDQHLDGLFIIDYKTSGTVPNGSEMLEYAYRLQLPFYSIAARNDLKKDILGYQFIDLTRRGTRNHGIFQKKYNGKELGKLTQVRSNSKSLISQEDYSEINTIWDRFEKYLQSAGDAYIHGRFEARPRIPQRQKECHTCVLADLCGLRRVIENEEKGSSEGKS